jgi:uncharacterized protein involved in type VI secretion and phage assembly
MKKWYGAFRAVVVEIADPMKLDRVRVRVPEVLGGTITDWVWPRHPAPFWSWKPKIDENVWVEFENGDIDRPLYTGTWYSRVENQSSIPAESLAEYPFHRMIKTPDGHKIEFKDISTEIDAQTKKETEIEDSPRYMRITTADNVNDEHHVIELSMTKDDEHITLESAKGNKIEMVDKSGDEKIGIETPAGHKITMDDANTELTIEHSDGSTKIAIDASGNVAITAKAGSKVQLSGAAALPLAGVVTTNHICAFTGSPHPQGSVDVEASG